MRKILVLCGLLAFFSAPAFAMRCGSRLVEEGESRAEVRAKCGDPSDVSHRAILRRPVLWWHGRRFYEGFDPVEVPIETWIYNLGPNKLMQRLKFEDGLLVEIESLGYGYRE